jgi:uncharacterized protein YjbJ (UPF0337 family)
MDEHRATGAARNVGGQVEEAIGRATGDTKSQARGAMDRAQGAAKISTAKRKMRRATRPQDYEKPQSPLKTRFAIRSRTSPIRL